MGKDDLGLVLKHMDLGRKVTDIYVDNDWSIVDELKEKVVNLLKDD